MGFKVIVWNEDRKYFGIKAKRSDKIWITLFQEKATDFEYEYEAKLFAKSIEEMDKITNWNNMTKIVGPFKTRVKFLYW